MNGITILNTYTNASSPSWTVGLMFGGIAFMIVGIMLFLGSQNFRQFVVGIALVGIGGVAVICGWIFAEKRATETPRYECLVSEKVNANELYDQYNVIEKRGEIWVLEEKDNDE